MPDAAAQGGEVRAGDVTAEAPASLRRRQIAPPCGAVCVSRRARSRANVQVSRLSEGGR